MKTFTIFSLLVVVVMSVMENENDYGAELTGTIIAEVKADTAISCMSQCKSSVYFPMSLPESIRGVIEDHVMNSSSLTWNRRAYYVRHIQKKDNLTQIFEAELITCALEHNGQFECDLGKYRNNIYMILAVPDGFCYSVSVDGIPKLETRGLRPSKVLYIFSHERVPQNFQLTRCSEGTSKLRLFVMTLICQESVYLSC